MKRFFSDNWLDLKIDKNLLSDEYLSNQKNLDFQIKHFRRY